MKNCFEGTFHNYFEFEYMHVSFYSKLCYKQKCYVLKIYFIMHINVFWFKVIYIPTNSNVYAVWPGLFVWDSFRLNTQKIHEIYQNICWEQSSFLCTCPIPNRHKLFNRVPTGLECWGKPVKIKWTGKARKLFRFSKQSGNFFQIVESGRKFVFR